MADGTGSAQMSRVQRELIELKQRGRVKTQADKLKDCKLKGVSLMFDSLPRPVHEVFHLAYLL